MNMQTKSNENCEKEKNSVEAWRTEDQLKRLQESLTPWKQNRKIIYQTFYTVTYCNVVGHWFLLNFSGVWPVHLHKSSN